MVDQGAGYGQSSQADPEGLQMLHKQSSLSINEDELAKQQEELKKLEQELEESKLAEEQRLLDFEGESGTGN